MRRALIDTFARTGRTAQAAVDAAIATQTSAVDPKNTRFAADAPENGRWVTKAEAARLAAVTTKTLERWAAAKWIRHGYRPSTRGGTDVVVYWLPSVLRQAAKRAQGRAEGLRVPVDADPGPDAPGAGLVPAAGPLPPAPLDPAALGAALIQAIKGLSHPSETLSGTSPSGPPAAFVDVSAFARLAGLPQADIRDLLAAGTLPHRTTRRGGIRIWAAHVALLEPKAAP